MASWLVRLPSDRAVLVRALPGDIVLCPLHSDVLMGISEINDGGDLAMD